MTDHPLDLLRAHDIAPDETPPPFAQTVARLRALDDPDPSRRAVPRPRRSRALLGGAVVAAALAGSVVVSVDPFDRDGTTLGVLQAAAAAAADPPGAGRFAGYVEETADDGRITDPAVADDVRRETVRPLTGDSFEVRTSRTVPAHVRGGVPVTDAEVTTTRDGDRTVRTSTWKRPYGTIFSGPLPPGARPAAVPADAAAARDAVASWALGRPPAGSDRTLVDLLLDAYGAENGPQLALGYAELVLTAPRVDPDVRAATYRALADVPGLRIDPDATDPVGRPAAAVSALSGGPTPTRTELFIDPGSSRVLGTRYRSTVRPGANDDRPANEPPYVGGISESVYRYAD